MIHHDEITKLIIPYCEVERLDLLRTEVKPIPEQQIEDFVAEILTGDVQKNALEFIVYLRASDMMFEKGTGYWEDKLYFMIKHKNEYVCFILINGSEDINEPWIVWSDDSDSNWFSDFPLDERTKAIVWDNVDICVKCGGCDVKGTHKTIFGKEFDGVCRTTFRFDNPNTETVECLKKLVEIRKNNIDERLKNNE